MKQKYITGILLALLWICCCGGSARAATETVTVPLTLDLTFIRMALIQQFYNQPDGRAVVVDEKEDTHYNYIALWNPEIRSEGDRLIIGSSIQVKQGVSMLGSTIDMINWKGYVELYQRVVFDEAASKVTLGLVDSHIYNAARKPIVLEPVVMDLMRTNLQDFFSQMVFDLNLPMDETRTILPYFFSDSQKVQVEKWLSSLKVSGLHVDRDAIRLNLSMQIETAPAAPPEETGLELTAAEMDRISELWEMWDAFLIFQMETLLDTKLTDDERQHLLETLLELRYGFVQAVNDKTAGNDLVRKQFVYAWEQLSGILRAHLTAKSGQGDLMKYLSFFTASDVLSTLDKLGPTLGIEISRDGLIRLAQLLSEQEIDLGYSPAVDANLRKLMGFAPAMDEAGPSYEVLRIPLPAEAPADDKPAEGTVSLIMRFLVSPAFAADAPAAPDVEALKPWIVPDGDIGPYLERVRRVLEKTADDALAGIKLDPALQPMYRLMIMATAWQESCWRQFLISKGTLTPLLSNNQSSVGLMQINQRIWRGFYKIESLRWNVEYNARAGAEILGHYLKDYALKKTDKAKSLSQDLLSRALYAMYNGGPGDFTKFLQRNQTQSFYDSDRLFWDKYTMAKAGEFDKVSICLQGK